MKPKRPIRPNMSQVGETEQNQTNGYDNLNDNPTPKKNHNENVVSNPFSNNVNKSPFGNPQQQQLQNNQNQMNNMSNSDYNYNPPPKNTSKPQPQFTKPPTKDEIKKQTNPQPVEEKHYEMSSIGQTTNSNQQPIQEKVETQKKKGNSYTLSETNQSHKRVSKNYKINPKVIPRPNHFDEIYKNEDELPIYNTNDTSLPPSSNTHFIVNETHNTTPRILRCTMNRINPDPSTITNSHLMFGMVMQPFAEFNPMEKEIPKVEVPEGIFRCKRCEAYINNKFKIDFNKSNKRIATCNLCSYQNELDTTNPKVKSEYFNSSIPVPELSVPTIDFIAPNSMKHQVAFIPHYLFMIDVSNIAVEVGLPSYILNSIQSNLDSIHNGENSYVGFATFDSKHLKFYYMDKSDDVKLAVVPDVERPFPPLPRSKLYLNIGEKREEIEKIFDRLNTNISEIQLQKNPIPGSASGAAISAGMQSLVGNGGRVIVFTSNTCIKGFGNAKPREDKYLTVPDKERSLYSPSHNFFKELAERYIDERIAVDLFVIGNTQLDFPTFSQISNFTGGKASFYPINTKVNNDLKQKLEKLHYDLTRILSRPNYYDVKLMFRSTIGFEVQEIIGQFGKRLGEGFKLPTMDPDFCFSYHLKIAEKLKPDTRYHFQIACLYIDNFNQRYLRMINYTVLCENDIGRLYFNVDADAMTKLIIQKEIILMTNSNLDRVNARENFQTKIINFLYFYRKKCSDKAPMQQLILPASVKFIPLFLTSLLKKAVLRKNKDGVSLSLVYSQVISLLRDPVYWTIKYLYPKFYRIDDIIEDQSHKVEDAKLVLVSFSTFNYFRKISEYLMKIMVQ